VLKRTRAELRETVAKDEVDEQKGKWKLEAEKVKKEMEQMRADLCKAIVDRDSARSERDAAKAEQDALKSQLRDAAVEAEVLRNQRDKAKDKSDKNGGKKSGSGPTSLRMEEVQSSELKDMTDELDATIRGFMKLPQAERKSELRKLRGLYHPDAQKVKTPSMQKFFTHLSQHVNRYCEAHLRQDCATCKT